MNGFYDKIVTKITELSTEMGIMELCGSHTAAMAKSGLKDALSQSKIHFVAGPGCPVCVTPASFITDAVRISQIKNIEIATFGDLLRVPGVYGETLANMDNVSVVYSPLQAVELAKSRQKEVVFLAVGFETTAPLIALAVQKARAENIRNFSILSSLKTMPTAFEWILKNTDIRHFLLPGHVCAISGFTDFERKCAEYSARGVVCGFTAEEMGFALLTLLNQKMGTVTNAYKNVVKNQGNLHAQLLIDRFFCAETAFWRGCGYIVGSGLTLREEYLGFSTLFKLGERATDAEIEEKNGCNCGLVLTGKISPRACPHFGKKCSPISPLGPCMVSSEGACRVLYEF